MNAQVLSVDRLIEALKSDGLVGEADNVSRLVYERVWTVGSELWGELGLELQRIRAACGPSLSNRTMMCLDAVMRDVQRVWPDMDFK